MAVHVCVVKLVHAVEIFYCRTADVQFLLSLSLSSLSSLFFTFFAKTTGCFYLPTEAPVNACGCLEATMCCELISVPHKH